MRRATVLFLILWLGAGVAWSQTLEDIKNCERDAQNQPDLAIHHCTRAINSGRLSDKNLSTALNNRGIAHIIRGNLDSAIYDFTQSIRLSPNEPGGFHNRAQAYFTKKDYDRALNDYQSAARIDPKGTDARAVGLVYFYLGRMAESVEALDRAVSADPQDKYNVLWRYLAQAKTSGLDVAQRELRDSAAKLDGGGAQKERSLQTAANWPTPVIDFYLGKIIEKAMYAAAEDRDSAAKRERLCEANFYSAEAKLLKKENKDAIPLLRTAEKDCPATFAEAHGASAELKRLGQ
ncbi:MAG: tetratricopeptide repeat protein [Candidatus Binatia bacterium]